MPLKWHTYVNLHSLGVNWEKTQYIILYDMSFLTNTQNLAARWKLSTEKHNENQRLSEKPAVNETPCGGFIVLPLVVPGETLIIAQLVRKFYIIFLMFWL